MSDAPLPTLESFGCFACGPSNPVGLRMTFTEAGPNRIRSEFQLGPDYAGIGDIVHGGIAATVLDEAMAWCLYRHRHSPHVTGSMEIRYRGTLRALRPLTLEAWIVQDRGKRLRMASSLWETGSASEILAEATGLYLRTPDSTLQSLPEAQRVELDGVFAEFRSRDGL